MYKSADRKKSIPFYTLFVEQRKDIDRSFALYSIKTPFDLLHADIADIKFFSKSAVDPKYCLVVVDLFMLKTYTYPMKSRHLLAQKNLFYWGIQQMQERVNNNKWMRLQTDLKFQHNEIKWLTKKYSVKMFSSQKQGGKAYAA